MKPLIRIFHPSSARRVKRPTRWLYLGKGIEPYERLRRQLGAENEWPYDVKLRQTTEELRRPFLDFVTAVGAEQTDPLAWWSTRFSWMRWTSSDLFLLTCYLAVAESCVEEARKGGFPLIIAVEDRWLLRQITENLGGDPHLLVERCGLAAERVAPLFLGPARRVKWLLNTLKNYIRQSRCWKQPGLPVPARPAAAIVSYPSRSAFETPGQWQDVYLPGLDRLLTEQGLQVVRICSPEYGGWERQIAERRCLVYPLILWATLPAVLRSLRAVWRPRWPRALAIQGRAIRWLCLREAWLEAGRASLCVYRLYYECLKRMLSRGPWRCVVNFYENQPWEKLQVLAARAQGVRTIGIQVSLFSRFDLPHALGPSGRRDRLPLPDALGSSGEALDRFWSEQGTPASEVRICGALRYPDLAEGCARNAAGASASPDRSRILVVLPIETFLARHLLQALARAFPDGGKREGLRFTVRPHPVDPLPGNRVPLPATVAEPTATNLEEDLSACGTVLFAASTVGLQALAQGKGVLRYRSPRLLDLDDFYGTHLPVASDGDLRARLLAQVRGETPRCAPEEATRLISGFFRPVDQEQLLALFKIKTDSTAAQTSVALETKPEVVG